MSIIDTPYNTTSKIACLFSENIRTVIRYYNFSNSLTFPNKCMELAEAQALAAHGMTIAAVFQQRQTQATDFSGAKGAAAGHRAYRHAQDNIGQPAGSGIYFSVDFDATDVEIAAHVTPYFQGVKSAFDEESGGHPEYRIGVYGSGAVSAALASKGLISLTWLAMSRGFRGTQQALNAGAYHLSQRAPAEKLCGLDVDFNDPNPNQADFGAFTIDTDISAPGTGSPAGERHRVIARSGLRLREGPGTQFEIVNGLQPDQVVFVMSVSDGWARIDVEGDGRVDGFAAAGFLEKV